MKDANPMHRQAPNRSTLCSCLLLLLLQGTPPSSSSRGRESWRQHQHRLPGGQRQHHNNNHQQQQQRGQALQRRHGGRSLDVGAESEGEGEGEGHYRPGVDLAEGVQPQQGQPPPQQQHSSSALRQKVEQSCQQEEEEQQHVPQGWLQPSQQQQEELKQHHPQHLEICSHRDHELCSCSCEGPQDSHDQQHCSSCCWHPQTGNSSSCTEAVRKMQHKELCQPPAQSEQQQQYDCVDGDGDPNPVQNARHTAASSSDAVLSEANGPTLPLVAGAAGGGGGGGSGAVSLTGPAAIVLRRSSKGGSTPMRTSSSNSSSSSAGGRQRFTGLPDMYSNTSSRSNSGGGNSSCGDSRQEVKQSEQVQQGSVLQDLSAGASAAAVTKNCINVKVLGGCHHQNEQQLDHHHQQQQQQQQLLCSQQHVFAPRQQDLDGLHPCASCSSCCSSVASSTATAGSKDPQGFVAAAARAQAALTRGLASTAAGAKATKPLGRSTGVGAGLSGKVGGSVDGCGIVKQQESCADLTVEGSSSARTVVLEGKGVRQGGCISSGNDVASCAEHPTSLELSREQYGTTSSSSSKQSQQYSRPSGPGFFFGDEEASLGGRLAGMLRPSSTGGIMAAPIRLQKLMK